MLKHLNGSTRLAPCFYSKHDYHRLDDIGTAHQSITHQLDEKYRPRPLLMVLTVLGVSCLSSSLSINMGWFEFMVFLYFAILHIRTVYLINLPNSFRKIFLFIVFTTFHKITSLK